MDPLKVAAQFAAFVWFTNTQSNAEGSEQEAVSFARANWIAFLPCAHEGLGRLLLRLGRPVPALAQAGR